MADKSTRSQGQWDHLEPKAEAVRKAAEHLAGFLPGKVMAYGAAHDIQPGIWAAMLAQYRDKDGNYVVPAALFDKGHVPRITRVLDRLIRIVSNPAIDPMGENPWLDAAGDCIAGMVMQGVGQPPVEVKVTFVGGGGAGSTGQGGAGRTVSVGDARAMQREAEERLRKVDTNGPQWCQRIGPQGLQCMRPVNHEGAHCNQSHLYTWEWDDNGSGSMKHREPIGEDPIETAASEDTRQDSPAWGEANRILEQNRSWLRGFQPLGDGRWRVATVDDEYYGYGGTPTSAFLNLQRNMAHGERTPDPHPSATRPWNEGPVHPEEGI